MVTLFDKYGTDSIIGCSDVVWVTCDSLTNVGKFINFDSDEATSKSVVKKHERKHCAGKEVVKACFKKLLKQLGMLSDCEVGVLLL